MKEILLEALRRMDSARSSIQRETGLGYGILDTSDLRQELEEYETTNKIAWKAVQEMNLTGPTVDEYLNNLKVHYATQNSNTLTNSEITAACIRAGITELHYIEYIRNNSRTLSELKEDIEYILNQKANEKANANTGL